MNSIQFQNKVAIIAIVLSFIAGTQGGFPGLICPVRGRGISLISCNLDCNLGHNSPSGKCGQNFNCFCALPRDTVNLVAAQCLIEAASVIFDEICTFDCQCNHGALGGQCDYVRHGCNCVGRAEPFRSLCPFGSAEEYLSWSKSANAAVGLEELLPGGRVL